MKINIAIIGCGRIAEHHCKSLIETKKFNIVAVCDIDQTKAFKLAEKYNSSYFTNYKTMFELKKEIELVSLMTPSGMHYYHSRDIISKFKKNLVIEKPTFMKTSHVREIYKLAKKYNVKIFPVYQNRYNKAVQFTKKIIKNNSLGKIKFLSLKVHWCRPQRYYNQSNWRGTFEMDGGSLTNQGVHFIDLLRFLGGDIVSVNSIMDTINVNLDVEDTTLAHLKFKNEAIGNLEVSTAARFDDYEASITIFFEKGYLKIGGIAANKIIFCSDKKSNYQKYNENFKDNVYGFGHISFYQDVFKTLKHKKKFIILEDDCAKTISFLNSLYNSAHLRKKISLKKDVNFKKLGAPSKIFLKKYLTK